MFISWLASEFTTLGGKYYSPPFKVEDKDNLVSIEATLESNSTVYVEGSIDSVNWYSLNNTSFSASPSGLECYAECQPTLVYRLMSTVPFISAKILI